MANLKYFLTLLIVLLSAFQINTADEVCVAANVPNLIKEFQQLNFQAKPICEKLMMIVSRFSPENQKKLYELWDENNVEYCFKSNGMVTIIDDDTVSDAKDLSTEATSQMQESRKPVSGCCSAGSDVAGTEVEAVDPNQPCADLAKDLGPPLMNLAKGYKKNCLLCRELAKGCIMQSIAVLQSAYLGKNGCIKFCPPTTDQVTKIKEAYTELLTPLDNIDNSIIQSSNDCVNKMAFLSNCNSDSTLLTTVDLGKSIFYNFYFSSNKY
jgi:hypothetical protein